MFDDPLVKGPCLDHKNMHTHGSGMCSCYAMTTAARSLSRLGTSVHFGHGNLTDDSGMVSARGYPWNGFGQLGP